MADSRYILFVDEASTRKDPTGFVHLEEQLRAAYMDERREPSSTSSSEDE